jgi:hypothetical protein
MHTRRGKRRTKALMELSQKRAGLDFEEGRWLLAAKRAEAHRQLGYGSFTEYVERLFGYAPRVTHDKLRVAAALETLPGLSQELREGGLSFSHVRELTRVAVPETESAWIEHARGCTSRQVEKLVSGHGPGSLPDSPREPEFQRHVLRFDVSGETLATFREAVAKLRREAGEHLDDDATLRLSARHVLGGPTDDGRASYQVALDVCEDCGRARQCADGELIDVAPTVAAMAECDAAPTECPQGRSSNCAATACRAGSACVATTTGAKYRVVGKELSWTSTIWWRARMAASITRPTC